MSLDVRVHDDFFAQDEADEVWLREVGGRNWLVITNDDRIRYRPAARIAIKKARVGVLILASRGSLTAEQKAQIFIEALPAVRRFLRKHTPPFIAKVRRDEVVLVWPSST